MMDKKDFDNWEHKTFPLYDVKMDDEEGTFSGYASIFNVVDSYGDSVMPGAFKRTLKNKGKWPLFYAHAATDIPIGTITGREDEKGLFINGKLTKRIQKAQEVREAMLDGSVNGLSIGYQTAKEAFDKESGVRQLKEINLWEVSLCVFQACPGAEVSEVKESIPAVDSAKATHGEVKDNDPAIGHSFTDLAEVVKRIRKSYERK